MTLVGRDEIALDDTARTFLDDDLPLVDDRVTVEHLLAHRSGIGDYLDEDELSDVTDHVMTVPVHRLDRTERYIEVLDGHPQISAPGERFAYNNAGYVLLALVAERATGRSFADLVDERVLRPAGMASTAFVRSDELPPDAAVGYLADGLRTNVLHLPVVGSGDGGLYSTAADVMALWRAVATGRIVDAATVRWMWTPQGHGRDGAAYGRGWWLDADGRRPALEGYDAGVSFRTVHDPITRRAYVVLSNTSEGAWPLARALDALLFD